MHHASTTQKVRSSNRFLSGVSTLTVSALIVKVIGLFYKIPLLRCLGTEGMGYFNSAYTVYIFFYIICTAGIPKAISILISESGGDANSPRVISIYKGSARVFGMLGVVFTVLFLLFSKPIAHLIGSNNALISMIAIAPSVMFTCSAGVLRGYFNGIMSFVPIAVSEAISGVSRLVLGLLFALYANYAGYDLTVVSALTILGTTIGAFLGYLYLYICKKKEKVDYNLWQNNKTVKLGFSLTKRILRISIPITLTGAISGISGIIDLLVVMNGLKRTGFSELQAGIMYGNYTTLVIPMLNFVVTLIAPLSTVLLPLVSKAGVKNDSRELSDKISAAVKILSFISVPAAVLFLLRSKEILSILFEDSSAVMAAPLLSVIAPSIIFMCLLTVVNTSLEGMGDTKIPLISLLVGLGIKLAVSAVLINNDNFGIYGAPIGTGISYIVSFVISLYYLSVRKKVKTGLASALLPVSFSSLVSIYLCSLLRNLINIENIYVYTVELIAFAAIYFAVVFLCFLVTKNGKNIQKLNI